MSMPYRIIQTEEISAWTGERATKRIEIPNYDGMQELYCWVDVEHTIAAAVTDGSARGTFGAIYNMQLVGDGSDVIWSLNSLEIKWLAHHWMRNIPQESTLATAIAANVHGYAMFTLPMMIPKGTYGRVELIVTSGDVDVDVVEEAAGSGTTLDGYNMKFAVKYTSGVTTRFYTGHAEQVGAASTAFTFKPALGYILHGAIVFTQDNSATPADSDDLADNIDNIVLKHNGVELFNASSEIIVPMTADIWNIDRDSMLGADGSTGAYVHLIPIDNRVATANTYLTVTTNASCAATDSIIVLWLMSTPVKASVTES